MLPDCNTKLALIRKLVVLDQKFKDVVFQHITEDAIKLALFAILIWPRHNKILINAATAFIAHVSIGVGYVAQEPSGRQPEG
ncbi:hypothetical protein [Parasitella parasitica]|uniref:Uncharacterized protein n=1 Tax=Parasitella parasitica TaxID=35722 RepID=A0A0B7N6Y2_9FUNG|nr:hypothetical protein [Parasitella parasitica]